jgi:hypothetical protein
MTLFFVLSGFVIHCNYRQLAIGGGLGGLRRFPVGAPRVSIPSSS